MFFCIEFRTREDGRPLVGAVVLEATSALDAAKRAGALGLNPGRHVDAVIAETRADVPASYRNRLLTDECLTGLEMPS